VGGRAQIGDLDEVALQKGCRRMPRFPAMSSSVADVGGSVFSSLAHRIGTHQGPVYPLHVGDTWLEPADGCRMQDLRIEDHPGMHRYAPPQGLRPLIGSIVERTRTRTGVPTEPANILITAGATGALGAVMGAMLEPGDEVLILAPYWPLITGIVRCNRGRPVAVPLIGAADSPETALEAVKRHHGPATVALYLSTPNNPTGRVLPSPWIEALVDWATAQGLWIVSDEVYEDYVYTGQHVYTRSLAPDRTFSAHSFSKAYGMAGNRCGYVVAPDGMSAELCKISTHAFYSTPTASQIAALLALDGRGDRWVASVKGRYLDSGRKAAKRLGVPEPEGSTFLFLDVADRLDERGLVGFLEDCADRGLFLAPGPSFGDYPTHVRICFTCAEPALVEEGVEVLARMLGR
jgi:aspartate/methionine/tyrosine aminotransferase